MGIDTIAHEAAIDAGLIPVCFPGSPIDDHSIYPRTNVPLAHAILKSGGALVSEYSEGQQTGIWTFPQRNRLMAGIASAVLIIEAQNKSGARITTKLAVEYNRDVLAVPGPISSSLSEGPNQLLREGATPITCSGDILEALGMKPSTNIAEAFANCPPEEQRVLHLLSSPMTRGDLIRALELPTHRAQILLSAMEIKGLIRELLGMVQRG